MIATPVVALATTALLVLGAGAATAAPAPSGDPDPIGSLLGQVSNTLNNVVKPVTEALPKAPAPQSDPVPKSLPKAPAPKAPAPKAPALPKLPSLPGVKAPSAAPSTSKDFSKASVADLNLGGQDVLGLSKNQSQVKGGTASGDATLLAIGGTTLIGSSATSDGTTEAQGPVPGNALCESSGGALCLDLLYADSSATKSGGTSQASTKTGLADACLGGTDPSGTICTGLHLGAGQSSSSVLQKANGESTSTGWTSLLNACFSQDGACTVKADAIGSDSSSGTDATPAKEPTLAALDLAGTKAGAPKDPIHVEVPKTCSGPDLLCATLNAVDPGDASTDSKSAADVDGLGDQLGLGLGSTSTGSSAAGTSTPPATMPGEPQPDLASATLEHLQLAGQDLLDVSKNQSTGDANGTKADASLLALLGTEIIGSHSTSDGTTEAHGPVPGNPLCDSSGGALCLDLLYADSAATKTPAGSDASTKTGVADLCLGGNDPTGTSCSGIEVGVAQGASELHKDATTGKTTAESSTSAANVCIHGVTDCTVGADAVASNGAADSAGGSSGGTSIADLGLDGTQVGAPSDPIELSVPTDCVSPSLACILLNQGDNSAGAGSAGTLQTVLQVSGLGGIVGDTTAQTQTSASQSVVEPPVVVPPVVEPPVVKPPVVKPPVVKPPTSGTPSSATPKAADNASSADNGVLPNTGGVWSGLVGLGLLLLAGGALVMVRSRRRQTV